MRIVSRSAAVLLLLVVTCACTASQQKSTLETTQRGLSTAYLATNAAHQTFLSWDKQHQADLVAQSKTKEEAEGKVAAYYLKRQKVVQAVSVAYSAIAAAATALSLASESKNANPMTLVALATEALRAAVAVKDAINELK